MATQTITRESIATRELPPHMSRSTAHQSTARFASEHPSQATIQGPPALRDHTATHRELQDEVRPYVMEPIRAIFQNFRAEQALRRRNEELGFTSFPAYGQAPYQDSYRQYGSQSYPNINLSTGPYGYASASVRAPRRQQMVPFQSPSVPHRAPTMLSAFAPQGQTSTPNRPLPDPDYYQSFASQDRSCCCI